MRIELTQGPTPADLGQALARFEAEFTYPLDAARCFRISHAGDPWRFFQGMGTAAYALAIQDERILGGLGGSLCRICSTGQEDETMLYLGDLKVTQDCRGGPVLLGLIRAITTWSAARAGRAFAVVMGGTAVTPDRYSGRLGIPQLSALSCQSLLWLTTADAAMPASRESSQASSCRAVEAARGEAAFLSLARGRFRGFGPTDTLRSQMSPQWLVAGQGGACGRLEDTLLAKRLFADDGLEMRSAHLAYVASRDLPDLLSLLSGACSLAAQAGYPMLFVALEPRLASQLAQRLGTCVRSLASTTIYACGMDATVPWHLNSSDI